MSDLQRNMATSPIGQTIGRTDTVAVDQGLRAYMLHIYNYMVLGLAITGLAALGIYMLSVTDDEHGDEGAAQRRANSGADGQDDVSDANRLLYVRQPAEMGDHAFAVRIGARAELRHRTVASGHSAGAVLDFRGADGPFARLDLHGVHAYVDRAGVLHHRCLIR